jgi:hypothetical protein
MVGGSPDGDFRKLLDRLEFLLPAYLGIQWILKEVGVVSSARLHWSLADLRVFLAL